MASVNKQIILGNLGRDAELKGGQNGGQQFTDLSIATQEFAGKGDDGKAKYETEWHSVRVWGNQAEFASKAKKGDTVYVEGTPRKRQDGDKLYVNINAQVFQLLTKRAGGDVQSNDAPAQGSSSGSSSGSSNSSSRGARATASAPAQQQTIQAQNAAPAIAVAEADDDLPF